MSQNSLKCNRRRAFAIFDLLAIVAIVALLASVLMPATLMAKAKARSAACLSNLNKQGAGFAAYARDNNHYLPYGGQFKYVLIDAGRRNLHWLDTPERWNRQGNGLLYPKYIAKTIDPFYCPSGAATDSNPSRGRQKYMQLYNKNTAPPPYGDSTEAPIGGYAYALPLARGKSPRDGTKQCYTDESMEEVQADILDDGTSKYKSYSPPRYSAFRSYLWDTTLQGNPNVNNYLGPIANPRTGARPNGPRGNHHVQALMVDYYFAGYSVSHIDAMNVVYSDFHAESVADPTRRIADAGAMGSAYTYSSASPFVFLTWDYLSSQGH